MRNNRIAALVTSMATVTVLVVLTVSGCAWVSVKPIPGSDLTTKGFRYYDAKPLLVVTDTNTQVIFVPNYSRAYAVRFGAFLAKHDFKLTIADGVFFKEVDDEQDPAEFLKGLVTLGQEALKAASSAAKAASDPVGGKLVAIYEFEFNDRGDIVGLRDLGNVPPRPPVSR
jgi:hypothetical protein